MPISQDRMMTVVRAAQRGLDAYRSIRNLLYASLGNPDKSADQIIEELESQCRFLGEFPDENAIIASELMHFKHAQHKNARRAAMGRIARGNPQPGDEGFIGRWRNRHDRRSPDPRTFRTEPNDAHLVHPSQARRAAESIPEPPTLYYPPDTDWEALQQRLSAEANRADRQGRGAPDTTLSAHEQFMARMRQQELDGQARARALCAAQLAPQQDGSTLPGGGRGGRPPVCPPHYAAPL